MDVANEAKSNQTELDALLEKMAKKMPMTCRPKAECGKAKFVIAKTECLAVPTAGAAKVGAKGKCEKWDACAKDHSCTTVTIAAPKFADKTAGDVTKVVTAAASAYATGVDCDGTCGTDAESTEVKYKA